MGKSSSVVKENAVIDKFLDDNWIASFCDNVKDISREAMQELWVRVLAREIEMKRFWKWAVQHQTIWTPLILLAVIAGVSWFFWKPLMTIEQDVIRNLILLTAGVIGWYFLYQRTKTADQSKKAAEKSAEATRKNTEISEQGLTTERLTRAMDQLADKNSSVRLGGILGLEQIAKIHEEERKKIARILVSFIRTQAAKNSERTTEDFARCSLSKLETMDDFSAYRAQRLDIEAAVNALASIASELEKQGQFSEEYNEQKVQLCDLQNTDLRGLRFIGADLSKFDLAGADMSGVWLARANLSEAWLYKVHFIEVRERTKLRFAKLEGANFTGAHLNLVDFHGIDHPREAKFNGSYLHGAIFTGVTMIKADFSNAFLEGANFMGAHLSEVKIGGSSLKNANLTGSDFSRIISLRQYQIEEIVCWKGYTNFISSLDERELQQPPKKERPAKFESCLSNGREWGFYKDSIGEWRWIKAMPGSQIDDSSNEGYKRKADCIADAKQHGMDCDPSLSSNE